MTEALFDKYRSLIKEELGNSLSKEKKATLEIKIEKILKRYHPDIKNAEAYYNILVKTGKDTVMWETFVDNITVHKTNFFREEEHFDYLRDNIGKILDQIPRIRERKEIRIWCAAASTGEEPYTIGMVFNEILPPGFKIKFLASDISESSLTMAIKGKYTEAALEGVDTKLREKYFDPFGPGDGAVVKDPLKRDVIFRKFNLMDPFTFRDKFDIIFCRNVMIYFDAPTKAQIMEKMHSVLVDDGILILGLSESLGANIQNFKLIKASMYIKT